MAALTLRGESVPGPGTGVNDGRLRNNVTILEEFLNMLAGISISDLSLLSGVKPDFALANASN